MSEFAGKLFVIGTPIGNREDVTARALAALREVDRVAAEDTRHTGMLLAHYNISKPFTSYHKFNEARQTEALMIELKAGRKIALVTDAGMPSISDPGHRLIRACREEGIAVEVLPGPSAVLQALVGSGFTPQPFYFGGFLPPKSGARQKELVRAFEREATSVYFESPHRLVRMLEDAAAVIPIARLCVARELTKKFEEYRQGSPAELLKHYQATPPKGEICIVIDAHAGRPSRVRS